MIPPDQVINQAGVDEVASQAAQQLETEGDKVAEEGAKKVAEESDAVVEKANEKVKAVEGDTQQVVDGMRKDAETAAVKMVDNLETVTKENAKAAAQAAVADVVQREQSEAQRIQQTA